MKQLFIILLTVAYAATSSHAQELLVVRNGCAVDNAEMAGNYYTFDPSDEATRIIRCIMDANTLEPNFRIRSGDVENALATVDRNERYIIYSTTYIERIKSSAGSDGAALFVFAHEIGHHLNNHRFDSPDTGTRKVQELQADKYAGAMLYRLGLSLAEAQAGVESSCRERESDTHPSRRARIEAVANGWKRAKEQSPVQPSRINGCSDTPPPVPDGMVFIQGGIFQRGSEDGESDEKPVRAITVSDFYLGKYEVTVGEFRRFVGDEAYKTDAEKEGSSYGYDGKEWKLVDGRNWRHDPEGNPASDNYPVINVSWNDVVAYCTWLSKKTGQTYRLPTEAEWEYAAGNGRKHTKFSWGNGDPTGKNGGSLADEQGAAHFNWTKSASNIFMGYNDGYSTTAPVGLFNANDLGLHDMTGNVFEWCSDWYGSDYYTNSPSDNPKGPTSGSNRVCRGGSWGGYPQVCRVANRFDFSPGDRYSGIGFRLARTK